MKRIVLITGAAGGLGRALTAKFLDSGWHVVATDTDDLSLAWLVDHPKALVIKMDVTSDAEVGSAVERVGKEFGQIDLVINNAGIDRYFPLSEAPVEQFRHIFEVNVFGAYRVNQQFLPLLRRPGGRILLIGSESLKLTVPFMPYPLTKRLLEGYARALRMELKFVGIDVVTVRPGAIDTGLLEQVRQLPAVSPGGDLDPPFRKFAAQASREIGRMLAPQEAASFVYRVATRANPAATYRINNQWPLRLAALLPFGWFEKLIYRKLK